MVLYDARREHDYQRNVKTTSDNRIDFQWSLYPTSPGFFREAEIINIDSSAIDIDKIIDLFLEKKCLEKL